MQFSTSKFMNNDVKYDATRRDVFVWTEFIGSLQMTQFTRRWKSFSMLRREPSSLPTVIMNFLSK